MHAPTQNQEVVRKARSAFRDHERPKVSRDHERRYAPFERLPGSVSERASDVDTAFTRRGRLVRPIRTRSVLRTAPDSAGDFPLQAVRSVPLLPVGHSATIAGARFLSRLNAGGGVVSIVLPLSTARVVNVAESLFANCVGAVSPPYSVASGRSVEEGELAPSPQKLNTRKSSLYT